MLPHCSAGITPVCAYYQPNEKINFNPLSAAPSSRHFEFRLFICLCRTRSRNSTLLSFPFHRSSSVTLLKFLILSKGLGLENVKVSHKSRRYLSPSGLNAEHCPRAEITPHEHNIYWHLVSVAKRSVSVFLIMTRRIIWACSQSYCTWQRAKYKGLSVSFAATRPDLFYRPTATLVRGNVITLVCRSAVLGLKSVVGPNTMTPTSACWCRRVGEAGRAGKKQVIH